MTVCDRMKLGGFMKAGHFHKQAVEKITLQKEGNMFDKLKEFLNFDIK